MTILTIPLPQLQALFLIFLRVSAIIVTAPLFDSKSVPLVFKIGAGFVLSIVLYSLVPVSVGVFQADVVPFFIGSMSEILLGVVIGLSVKLVFSGIQLAGQLAGFQMGFAIANVVDTVSNAQVSIIAQLKNIVAMLIFLSTNAHYYLIQALVENRLPPPGTVVGASDVALCEECPRSRTERRIDGFRSIATFEPDPEICLLEQGVICCGPATRGGCGAACIASNMPCRGCYGPLPGVIDQGSKLLSAVASVIDASEPEEIERIVAQIEDPAGTFYRFGLPRALLPGAQPRNSS